MGFKAADRSTGRARAKVRRARAAGADVEALAERVAELEEYARELNWKILILSTSKLSDPRYAYWNYMLVHGLYDERSRLLLAAMSYLADRLAGSDVPQEMRKDIPGVPRAVLFGPGPPTAHDVSTAIRAIIGLRLRRQHVALVRALLDQGLFRDLCHHVLDEMDGDDEAGAG